MPSSFYLLTMLAGGFMKKMMMMIALSVFAQNLVSMELKTEVPFSESDPPIFLGSAYDKFKMKAKFFQCLLPEKEDAVEILVGNSSGSYQLDISPEYSVVLDRLSGRLSADVDFGVVRASANASYAREMAADEFSTSYLFSYSINPKSKGMKLNSLKINPKIPLENITDYCGHEFVSKIRYGGHLSVNLKLEFRNKKEKKEIGGRLKVKVGEIISIVDVEGELNKLSIDEKKSVKISVNAIQKGGNPLLLASTIPENIIQCTLENPQPCFNSFVEIVKYAKKDFPSQFNKTDDFNIISYITTPYEDAGFSEFHRESIDELFYLEINHLREEMSKIYNESISHQERARKLLRYYASELTSEQQEKVKKIKEMASDNARNIFHLSKFCQVNMNEKCLEKAKKEFDSLNQYDLSLLEIQGVPIAESENNDHGEENKKCEDLRYLAMRENIIDKREYMAMVESNYVPIFRNIHQPKQGVAGYVPCSSM